MKLVHDGKYYDTDKCEKLAEVNHRNYNNNYSGTTYLIRASNGQYLYWTDTNGQDLYLRDSLDPVAEGIAPHIDGYKILNIDRCVELGILTVVD